MSRRVHSMVWDVCLILKFLKFGVALGISQMILGSVYGSCCIL